MLAITVCLLYNNSSTSFIMNNSIFTIIIVIANNYKWGEKYAI